LGLQVAGRHEVGHGYQKDYYEVDEMVFQVEDGVGKLLFCARLRKPVCKS
jgi:hypothetical protein